MAQREQRITSAARILDAAARYRRKKKALEALEQDNFHDEPHADLVMSKKVPKFQESNEKGPTKKRKQRSSEYYKLKFRKAINTLIEEEQLENVEGPNYSTAAAPSSKLPPRSFCTVCGFPSTYNCIPCGGKYCSLKCLKTHQETRCLKWTA
ncbi:Zinc finger HIT domain-containing protein 1 [Orchesella cincta]|uniref:Zinc finger HIT domain-containing protein 1 n=1 Tax=Orchesella cincta TaxID=48709 RepID=A0A1D2NJ64_ORCCI|nr:Zinc finger HIT domain-containing protein 1 [Orchesella cincta]